MPLYARFTEDGLPGWIGSAPIEGAEELPASIEIEGETIALDVAFLAAHLRTDKGAWLPRPPPPPPTKAELAAMAEEEARRQAEAEAEARRAADRERKLAGITFEGVQCSATSADQSGLLAVLTAIQMQGAKFVPTRFEFENGSNLVIHLDNYQAFMAAWLPFRQSFFRVI